MATKVQENEEAAAEAPAEAPDGPLLDLSDAAVKKMIKAAQEARLCHHRRAERRPALRGSRPPSRSRTSIADAQRHGHQRRRDRRGRGGRRGRAPRRSREGRRARRAGGRPPSPPSRPSEPTDRTDDPVRMYLREMGSVELLSREGEIAIAKRIEAGRETMIAGLCESPLTFQAIIIWRDELNAGKILLRDIIDLEATYAGPDAKTAPAAPMARDRAGGRPPNGAARPPQRRPPPVAQGAAAAAPPTARRSTRSRPSAPASPPRRTTRTITRTPCRSPRWRPSSSRQVVETFDTRRRRLQEAPPPAGPGRRVQARRTRRSRPRQERRYKKLKDEIVTGGEVAVAQPGAHRLRWSSSSTTSTSA